MRSESDRDSMANGRPTMEAAAPLPQVPVHSRFRGDQAGMAALAYFVAGSLDRKTLVVGSNEGIVKLTYCGRDEGGQRKTACLLCGEILLRSSSPFWDMQTVLDLKELREALQHRCAAGLP